jgi:mono/diheme cytochrome c family protein
MRRIASIALGLALASGHHVQGETADQLWASKVRPLFDVHCVKCHGPLEQKGGLELDRPEAVLKGGDEGPVVVPGDAAKSRLVRHLAPDGDPHMPPKKQLADADRDAIAQWVQALKNPVPADSAAPKPPRHFESVSAAIDGWIAEGWVQRGLTPAPAASDSLWCRRVYLDLAGRIPAAAEVAAFLAAPAATRRASLVDQLLSAPGYPVRMRELWDVFLMGRPKRDSHEDRRRQNGWWTFLETAFRENRPWDETVRAMLVGRPSRPDDQGASWFLYERHNEPQQIAEAVAPLVYGTKIDCAQCHDHPLTREIKQAHYWGLVAAFNRSKNVDGGNEVGESAIGGFINFTNLKKESQPAVVLLLTGRKVEEVRPAPDQKETDSDDLYLDPRAKARVPKQSRRAAFAEAATRGNPLLARAFVNRMWAALIGRGLVHPADEMNGRNPPSHPELLDALAADFEAHHYDIRRLLRGILLSRVYGLSAGTTPPETFASAPERPLTAEQIARSWAIATGRPADNDTLRRAVVQALPDVLPRDYNASFQQAQFLANSPAFAELLKPADGGAIQRIAALPDPAERVRQTFLAVYDRTADGEELQAAMAVLKPGSGDAAGAAAGVSDLFWALLTSAEFLTLP